MEGRLASQPENPDRVERRGASGALGDARALTGPAVSGRGHGERLPPQKKCFITLVAAPSGERGFVPAAITPGHLCQRTKSRVNKTELGAGGSVCWLAGATERVICRCVFRCKNPPLLFGKTGARAQCLCDQGNLPWRTNICCGW